MSMAKPPTNPHKPDVCSWRSTNLRAIFSFFHHKLCMHKKGQIEPEVPEILYMHNEPNTFERNVF